VQLIQNGSLLLHGIQHGSHWILKDWPAVSLLAKIARCVLWFRLEIGSFADWGTKLGRLWDHAGCSSSHDCQGSTSRRILTRMRGFHTWETKKMMIILHIHLSNFDAWKYGGRHMLRMPLCAVSALESYNFIRKCRSDP
jgi:hypothetical protein